MTTPQASAPAPASPSSWLAGIRLLRLGVALGVLVIALAVAAWWFVRSDRGPLPAGPVVAPAVSTIAAGSSHTCAVTAEGQVKCWGANTMGQLGDGTFTQRLTPVAVGGLERVRAIATGSGAHTCALTEAGAVKCWGANEQGQLGNGDTGSSSVPVQVVGLETGALGIAVGRSHSCAVTTTGLVCWGDNSSGALGNGSGESSLVPVPVEGFTARTAIALGDAVSCGIADGGRVRCWGDDGDGQLGDQNFTAVATPVPVPGIDRPVVSVSVSDTHVCVVTVDATVWCWGANRSAQLGRGATSPSSTPAPVPAVQGVARVVAGFQRTCALQQSGPATCWGGVDEATPGSGRPSPATASDLGDDVAALSLGSFHGCLVTGSGGVKCWGTNTNGQLGDGSTTDSVVPVEVKGF